MRWAGIAVLSAALMAPGAEECSSVEAAHRALLKSSFSAERSFSLMLNGELKAREVSRVTYSDGELAKEIIEHELLDDNLVLDEGEGEAALRLPFACERLNQLESGAYELSSLDGTEKAVFVWSKGKPGILEPISWQATERKRFLWKKLVIEAEIEYRNFAWQ